jgi:poly(beta-D-mannuronate) lyase
VKTLLKILLALLTFSVGLVADEIINTSFESSEYSAGSINNQHNWTISSGSAEVMVSSDSAYTGTQSLHFATSSTLKTQFTPFSSSVDGPSDVVYFDARVRVDELLVKYFAFHGYDMYSGSEKRAFVLEFNTPSNGDGVFQGYNGSSKQFIADYDLGAWYRISARIDYNTATYQVIFNGVASDVLSFREDYTSTHTDGEKQFHQLRVNLGYDSASGSVDAFVDDLYMGSDPIPGIAFDEVVYTWSIDVEDPDYGSIVLSPDLNEYEDSSWVTASVDLPDGYKLNQWTGDLSGSDSVNTFQITSDMSIGADVAVDLLDPPATYSITVNQPAYGSITLSPYLPQYYSHSNVRATIDIPAGYLFEGWTGDLSGTDLEKDFTVLSNMTIGASVVVDTIPATVYTFSSASAFEDKCEESNLRPGDIIELTDGNYNTGGITITAKGTAAKPIIIRSQNRGGANLMGDSDFVLELAEYITIEGFEFTSDTYTVIKLEACNNIHITRNFFRLTNTTADRGKWILIGGIWDDATKLSHHNIVDYNLFENKLGPGNFITIDGGDNVSQYDQIRFNYFKNIGPRIENEMEAIRVGVTGMSLTDGFTLIEHNLFEDCDGDPEIVSIKSCKDTVRYNTFIECQGTVCLRQGNESVVDGNFFFGNGKAGTGGVRLYSRNHIIVNNHFQDLTGDVWDAAITMTNGDTESGSESAHWQIQNAKILNNTFVNTKAPFEIGYPKADNSWKKVPINCRIAGNVIYGSVNPAVVYKSTPTGFTWEKNIYYDPDSLKPGQSLSSAQLQIADPGLENSAGFYKPTVSGLASGYMSTIEWPTDIQGRIRTSPTDAGAALYRGTGDLKNRPLSATDVGPNATELVIVGTENTDTPIGIPNDFNAKVYPNPFNPNTSLQFELLYDSNVNITIFTLNGRRVETVSNRYYQAGIHNLTWTPKDLSGGIYLISIADSKSVQVVKALYLK